MTASGLRAVVARGLAVLLSAAPAAHATDLPEYRLKAAFVYNFLNFTEWPATSDTALNLCIHGRDPFGAEIDGLQGKMAAGRSINVLRKASNESLDNCHVVFITASMAGSLPAVLERLKGQARLTVADTPGAMHKGVALNMNVAQGKVTFEANLLAARGASLNLSSKLLRLATEVLQ